MRDDQVIALIKKESDHLTNVFLLNTQSVKMGVEALVAVMSDWSFLFKIFWPGWFNKKFNAVYSDKAKAFNDSIRETIAKERLKI